MHQRVTPEGSNLKYINHHYVRGSLCPDRGSEGGADVQVNGSSQHHRSISARSGIRLHFDRETPGQER